MRGGFLLLLVMYALFAASFAVALGCGDTIYEDTVLTEDLMNCPERGIIIGADNITLDCKGHRVDGQPYGNNDHFGISLQTKTGVTIKNCYITEFYQGLVLFSSSYNLLESNYVSVASDAGIYLSSGFGNFLQANNVSNNGGSGINLVSSTNSMLLMNTVTNNGGNGISLFSHSQRTDIRNNTLQENGKYGGSDLSLSITTVEDCAQEIENNIGSGGHPLVYFNTGSHAQNERFSQVILCDADNSTLTNITVVGSDSLKNNGFMVYFTDNAIFDGITSSHHWFGMYIWESSGNTFISSMANDNAVDGISLRSNSRNNRVIRNILNGNDYRGVYVEQSFPVELVDNTVQENKQWDIALAQERISECNNQILNNTGSGNRPFVYFNETVVLNNEIFSGLILCNADNSLLTNVTVVGSALLQNNGVILRYIDNTSLISLNSSENREGITLFDSFSNTLKRGVILDNGILDVGSGISVHGGGNNLITEMLSQRNPKGIFLGASSDNVLGNNTLDGNGYGIDISLGFRNQVLGNKVSNNKYPGINLYGDNNTILTNSLENNSHGLFFAELSNNNTITKNQIMHNKDSGITLHGLNNTISRNSMSNNDNGIVFTNASFNTLFENNILGNNRSGVSLEDGSRGNLFFENYFLHNRINAYEEVASRFNQWNLSTDGNYWSDFARNPGYPMFYQISGPGQGIDWFPREPSFTIIDDSDPGFLVLSGNWWPVNLTDAYNGQSRYKLPGNGSGSVGWRVDNLLAPRSYAVFVWRFGHRYSPDMATNAPYRVYHRQGTSPRIEVDQSAPGSAWISLGVYDFNAASLQGVILNDFANGYVLADALQFFPVWNTSNGE